MSIQFGSVLSYARWEELPQLCVMLGEGSNYGSAVWYDAFMAIRNRNRKVECGAVANVLFEAQILTGADPRKIADALASVAGW